MNREPPKMYTHLITRTEQIRIVAEDAEMAEAIAERLPFGVWRSGSTCEQLSDGGDPQLPIYDIGDLQIEDVVDITDEFHLTHVSIPEREAEA